MKEVASLELCRKLYELSGWLGDTEDKALSYVMWDSQGDYSLMRVERGRTVYKWCPAYSIGYLLRQLPPSLTSFPGRSAARLRIYPSPRGGWTVCYQGIHRMRTNLMSQRADTPEDAACKLAIELFKQGILKKDA